VKVTDPSRSIEEDTRGLAGQFEQLRRQDSRRLDAIEDYATAKECRAVFLRAYFGEDADEPCGLCDFCRGQPRRPTGFFAPLALPKAPEKPKRSRGRRRGGRGRPRRRRRGGGGGGGPGGPGREAPQASPEPLHREP
jgi:hypothetical protein